jgi:hypothetical protein
MTNSTSDFLGAARRRLWVIRAVECIGRCLAAASAAGLVLVPILLWRGGPALDAAVGLLGAAIIAGVAWGISWRPTLLETAAAADRQLSLDDLLSTWLFTSHDSRGDEWAMTLIAMADARCRGLSPSQLVFNRLGARHWSGIGLVASLVLTLGLMSSEPAPATAASSSNGGTLAADSNRSMPVEPIASANEMPLRPPGAGGHDNQPNPPRTTELTNDSAAGSGKTTTSTDNTTSQNGATEHTGQGTGSAQTNQPAGLHSPAELASSANSSHANGKTAGGAGVPTEDGTAGASASAGTTATGAPARATPPWSSDTWPADRDAAHAAVRSGRVADRYRDMVQDYFDRP